MRYLPLLTGVFLSWCSAASGQIIGEELCACSPSNYEFTLDFGLFCPPVNITSGNAVDETSCVITPFGDPNVVDLVPVEVQSIDILELGQGLRVLVQENIAGVFVDGDTFTYASLSAVSGAISEPADIPRAIQINIVATNQFGESLINVYIITFTNNCGAYPVLEAGQHAGWTSFTNLQPPIRDFCPFGSTMSPTTVPISPTSVPTPSTTEGTTSAPSSVPSISTTSPTAPFAPGSIVSTPEPSNAPSNTIPFPSEVPTGEFTFVPSILPSLATVAPTELSTSAASMSPTSVTGLTDAPSQASYESPASAPTELLGTPTAVSTGSSTQSPSNKPTTLSSTAPEVPSTPSPTGSPSMSATVLATPTTLPVTPIATNEPSRGIDMSMSMSMPLMLDLNEYDFEEFGLVEKQVRQHHAKKRANEPRSSRNMKPTKMPKRKSVPPIHKQADDGNVRRKLPRSTNNEWDPETKVDRSRGTRNNVRSSTASS